MDFFTGRPNHIEDFLVKHRSGQWFGWSNPKNKIYANLIVHDGGSKPTEQECTDGLKAQQDAFDAEYDSYRSKRRDEYPSIGDQLDNLYQDIAAGKVDATGEFAKAIKTIKDKYPKS